MDHLLVFKGGGEVKDFPGNYTQYRESQKLLQKSAEATNAKSSSASTLTDNASNAKPRLTEKKRRLTFKERKEFEQLELDIENLEIEKSDIETALSSGTISVDEITAMSKRLPLLNEELDEKSMRWLELSEYN